MCRNARNMTRPTPSDDNGADGAYAKFATDMAPTDMAPTNMAPPTCRHQHGRHQIRYDVTATAMAATATPWPPPPHVPIRQSKLRCFPALSRQ